MTESAISLRPVTLEDGSRLFEWRNHPAVRQFALQPDAIDRESHCQWLQATLENPLRVLLLGQLDGEPVGVLRYDLNSGPGSDYDGAEALVSVYLVPQRMGQGLGAPLLVAGHAWLLSHRPAVRQLNAQIVPANVASVKVFEKAGYQAVSPQGAQGVLQYVYRF
ncbi:GNAT family N-acetyltransferase [Vampirovibrio chlorellavorus]|uniref:GNAT family N-acetyltransferase n=1 Tax=Vampirovibrio chlorellavorus TaxID=758823 RepID=UPI0026EDD6E9|nr:GNAT family N-acetyltransferase [Vampirovibrio chlorellavorus]